MIKKTLLIALMIGLLSTVATLATGAEDDLLDDPSVKKTINAIESLYSNRPLDGVSALTLLFIGSFIVDRFSFGLLALLSHTKIVPHPRYISAENGEQKYQAKVAQMVAYYAIAIGAAIALVYFSDVYIMQAVGFRGLNNITDQCLTAAVLVIGAERVASWLNLPGTTGTQQTQPVEVSGEMVLVEPNKND